MNHLYKPTLMKIEQIKEETSDVKTFRLVFLDPLLKETFQFKAGQFAEISVFGEGEATFCIASSPTWHGFIECSVKRAGKVTQALHQMDVGDTVGFRGPYGNHFPVEEMRKKDLVFVAGGIGLAPLRSLIWNCLYSRDQFGKITILYGARSVADLVYKEELKTWETRHDTYFIKTVDPGGETNDWDGKIGFVPLVMRDLDINPQNAYAIVCGPPVMIKFTVQGLDAMGFSPEKIITTLEMKMKCGLGKCGRCNIGHTYVCKDGPVFSFAEIQAMPAEF
ncbi:FAD/NAD(P)-binding protein [bacterium]|nr:FAD/NAD(P)-binding protein [bacterium]